MIAKRIRLALLGWTDQARCLVEAWRRQPRGVEVTGVVSLPEGGGSPPDGLNLRRVDGIAQLNDIAPVTCIVDMRPIGSPTPYGLDALPPGVAYVGPGCVELLVGLCGEYEGLFRYRRVVESAVDAVVTIDETHRIVFFNKAAEAMFGFRGEEVIGQDLSLLIPEPHKGRHAGYVRRYVETRSGRFIDHTVELEAERRSGGRFPVRMSFSVAEEGDHLLMTAMIHDITELKAMERKAIQNERLASVGKALSFVSHEIRNPLTVIGGLAMGISRCPVLRDQDRQRLDTIIKEVERLERLLTEIRDVAKPIQLAKQEIHLGPLLGEVTGLFRDSGTRHEVTFSLDVEGDPVVEADPDRLRQVVVNLVKNGLEAISGPGRVDVRAWKRDDQVHFEIRDTGQGIAPETMEQIFEPFVTTKEGGAGLGLSLCRRIVRDHGGDLEIESTPGEGTRVRVHLPARPDVEA